MAKALQLTRARAVLAAAERECEREQAAADSNIRSVSASSALRSSPLAAPSRTAAATMPPPVALSVARVDRVDDAKTVHAEPHKRAYQRAAVLSRLPSDVRNTCHSIEMIRKLPSSIVTSVLPASSLLMLLQHDSLQVRDAALPLVRRSLREESAEVQDALVRAAVHLSLIHI